LLFTLSPYTTVPGEATAMSIVVAHLSSWNRVAPTVGLWPNPRRCFGRSSPADKVAAFRQLCIPAHQTFFIRANQVNADSPPGLQMQIGIQPRARRTLEVKEILVRGSVSTTPEVLTRVSIEAPRGKPFVVISPRRSYRRGVKRGKRR